MILNFKLFLLGSLLISCFGSTYAVTQSFSRVASFYGQVSNAHLGVSIDFADFGHFLSLLDKSLKDERFHDRGLYGTSAILGRLRAIVADVGQRHEEYQAFFADNGMIRHKRQLGAAIGIGIGLAALYDVEDLRGTVGQLQSRQNSLVRIMACVTNDTIRLTRNFNRLRGALIELQSVEVKMEQILEVEAAVLQISSMADKLFRGLEELMAGRLSFDLVHDAEVRREFHELRSAAFNKGYEVVFPSPSQVFQLPASFLAENGKVHVIVDVPIVPIRHFNDFDLYHYHSVPFLLGNQLVRVRSTGSLLAVNKDKSQFMEIFHSQLKGCLHLGKTVLCRYPSVIRAGAAQCCLRAVFEGNADAIFKACQLTFIKSDFVLERLNATSFLSYANISVTGSLTCDETRKQIHFQGYSVMNIAPGCVLFARGITFVSAFDPVLHFPTITTRFSPPQKIVDHFANRSSQISEALSRFDYVDYNALVEGGEELEDMAPWVPTSSRIFGFLGGGLIGAFSLAAVVVFFMRGRVLSLLLGWLCPRAADGLASPLGEAAARAMTEAGVARAERLMRTAPRRTESEERLRRLPISPASTPELSEEEDRLSEPMEVEPRIARVSPTIRVPVDASRMPLFPRNENETRPVLDPRDL